MEQHARPLRVHLPLRRSGNRRGRRLHRRRRRARTRAEQRASPPRAAGCPLRAARARPRHGRALQCSPCTGRRRRRACPAAPRRRDRRCEHWLLEPRARSSDAPLVPTRYVRLSHDRRPVEPDRPVGARVARRVPAAWRARAQRVHLCERAPRGRDHLPKQGGAFGDPAARGAVGRARGQVRQLARSRRAAFCAFARHCRARRHRHAQQRRSRAERAAPLRTHRPAALGRGAAQRIAAGKPGPRPLSADLLERAGTSRAPPTHAPHPTAHRTRTGCDRQCDPPNGND
mmetsp:Transcript_15974/g.49744  ORF Transcript_15974/g.49744 Transcript_15974/m.49744 type:complete len:287 (-) Transcript_15974:1058-1918(-)